MRVRGAVERVSWNAQVAKVANIATVPIGDLWHSTMARS